MSESTAGRPRFDEAAALEELEAFRREIERYRLKRKAAEEEFELFTASFKQSASVPVVPAPTATTSHDLVPPSPAQRAAADAAPAVPAPTSMPSEHPAVDQQAVDPAPRPRPGRRHAPATYGIAAATIILVAAGSYFVSRKPKQPTEVPRAAIPPSASAPAHPAPTEPAPAPAASQESVVTTTSAVWVRVIADGVPIVERQLPPNTRLPFTARESIVIRAGDAGAIRLTIQGVDQGTLGRTGEVVTRRFDVRARRKEM
jgi:hypothetical protein